MEPTQTAVRGLGPAGEAIPFDTLPGLLLHVTATFKKENALSFPRGGGWDSLSHASLLARVRHLGLGLKALGIAKGESVGLIAPSSPLWIVVDLAIQVAQGVTVPIFKRVSPESFSHEVRDSGMRYLFVGNPDEIPMAREHAADGVKIISFWYTGMHEDFEKLSARGRELDESDPGLFDSLCACVKPADLATILYTSGTMGLPKGVELTQANLVSQVKGCAMVYPPLPDTDVCLSALPLDHIFERMVMYYYIASGMPVYFVDDPKRVGEYMKTVRPTIMTAVPRILEKVAMRITEGAQAARGAKGVLARAAIRRARKKPIEPRIRGPLDALFVRAVHPHFTEALGGRLRILISGSAKLAPEVARLLINIGVPVYEGYGLTEASPVIAVNSIEQRRLGTVGRIFPGVEARIAEDGEILARGPGIMRCYHDNPKATAEVLDSDGWLHTGDLGSLDPDGFLSVTGRKKEMFKKSTGEYVPPVPIENALGGIPWVDTAVVIGDNRTCVVALLFPDMEKLKGLMADAGLDGMDGREFLKGEYLKKRTQERIDAINAHLHHAERVERFAFLDHAPQVESGEISQTLKPRRFVIEQKYREIIEGLYASIGGWK